MSRGYPILSETHRLAITGAQSIIMDALEDCRSTAERHDVLIVHLSVGGGLLAHEVGAKNAAAALRAILRALEGSPS